MAKRDYRVCTDCGNTYCYKTKKFLNGFCSTEKYMFLKDEFKIQARICDHCNSIVGYGEHIDYPLFCKHCDKVVTTHVGCPKCKSFKSRRLNRKEIEPIF